MEMKIGKYRGESNVEDWQQDMCKYKKNKSLYSQ